MFKRYVLPALCVSATLGVSVLCYWTSWYYSLKRIKGYNEQKAIESQETNFWDGSPNIQFRVIDLDGYIAIFAILKLCIDVGLVPYPYRRT